MRFANGMKDTDEGEDLLWHTYYNIEKLFGLSSPVTVTFSTKL